LGFIEGKSIERVHLHFCINILGVKKATPNVFVYGELGRMPLQTYRHYKILT